MTLKSWSEINGFNARYVSKVITGERGAWQAGTAEAITNALKSQGLWPDQKKTEEKSA